MPAVVEKPRLPGRRRWLRWVVWGGVLLFLTSVGLLWAATRPALLEARVREALGEFKPSALRFGAVRYSPWAGIEALDVELAFQPPEGNPGGFRDRVEIHVPIARITLDLAGALRGTPRAGSIELRRASASIYRDPARGLLPEVETAGPDDLDWLTHLVDLPPVVFAPNLDLRLFSLDDGGEQLVRRWVAHLDIRRSTLTGGGREDGVLQVRCTQAHGASGAPAGASAAEAERLVDARLHVGSREIEAAVGWIDAEVLWLLFPRLRVTLGQVNARGRVCLDQLHLRGPRIIAATGRFADVHFALPFEDQPVDARDSAERFAAECFLQARGFGGEFALADQRDGRTRLRLNAAGTLNDSPTRWDFSAEIPERSDDRLEPGRPRLILDRRQWNYHAQLAIERFTLPTPETAPRFVAASRFPNALHAFLNHYSPRGQANLRLDVQHRADRPDDSQLDGRFEPVNAYCRYFRFPYDVRGITGAVRLSHNDQDGTRLHLENLAGTHGNARVRIDGDVYLGPPEVAEAVGEFSQLNLEVQGQGLALDRDLYEALPDEYRALWENATPLGLADVRARINRPLGRVREPDVAIDAHLISASLDSGDGQRLTRVEGHLTIDEAAVRLHDLHGYLGSSAVRVSGVIAAAADCVQPTNLRIEAVDVPISETVAAGWQRVGHADSAAPNPPAAVMPFTGAADVWGRRSGSTAHGTQRSDYTVHIRDGQLGALDGSAPWTQARGWVALRAGAQHLSAFEVRRGPAWLRADGVLPRTGGHVPLELNVAAGDEAIDELLARLLPEEYRGLQDALGVSGRGQLTLRLAPPEAAEPGVPPGAVAEVELSAAQFRPRVLPLPLRDVRATLRIADQRFKLHELQGQFGEQGVLHAVGSGSWAAGREATDLTISAAGADFSPDLLAALPDGLRGVLARLGPRGGVDATLERVRVVGARPDTVELSGELRLRGVTLSLGVALADLHGQVRGTGRIDAARALELSAGFSIDRGEIAGRSAQRIEGVLRATPGDPWLHLEEVHGRLCDGTALGSARINATTGEYEVDVTLQDASLDELLPRRSGSEAARPGRVDGHIFVRGRGAGSAAWSGGGELRLRGSSLGRTPILGNVAEASRGARRDLGEELEVVDLRLGWNGPEVRFLRVEVQGASIRLVGEGRWNLQDDSVALTLVGAHPRNWPRVAVLTDLLEIAGKELIQYRVDGTLSSPRVTAEPLYTLTEPIRRLLSGEG